MAKSLETDVCIIGGGICAAMVAEKLADDLRLGILVVEAGDKIFNLDDRFDHRERYLAYGENPWPNDHIRGQTAYGIQSRTMALGGQALHFGGTMPRFVPEDFRVRSLYGIGDDWPIGFEDLEPFYEEAEERMGVAGEQGPPDLDVRAKPYPMPPHPYTYTLRLLKEWGEKSGIPFWRNPVCKNSIPYRGRPVCCRLDTCNICPIGAKYSPDFTFQALLEQGRIELLTRTLVRRLVLEDGTDRIGHAVAVDRDNPDESVHLRARIFVLAAGYAWSPHLLLLSANDRFPDGLANRSGLVGRYITGHASVSAMVDVPMKLYPGMFLHHSLRSSRFQRPAQLDRYVRHDLRIWPSDTSRPRLVNDAGEIIFGDDVLQDWRGRCQGGRARLRAYYDVLPSRDSALTLDPAMRNEWGDPMPRITLVDSDESVALREYTVNRIQGIFEEMVRAGGGRISSFGGGNIHDHPGGGCRMGDDPATSVVDSFGRCHDHENLFVVGAPTMVTGACTNSAPTLAALSLRSVTEIGRDL